MTTVETNVNQDFEGGEATAIKAALKSDAPKPSTNGNTGNSGERAPRFERREVSDN